MDYVFSNVNTIGIFISDEFLYSAQMMSQITPLEVDILFVLCNLIHPRGGFVPMFFITKT